MPPEVGQQPSPSPPPALRRCSSYGKTDQLSATTVFGPNESSSGGLLEEGVVGQSMVAHNWTKKPNGVVLPTKRLSPTQPQYAQSTPNLHAVKPFIRHHNAYAANAETHGLKAVSHESNLHGFGVASKKNASSPTSMVQGERKRVPFVTTVKTGEFLDPPPLIAHLVGLDTRFNGVNGGRDKTLYAYSNRPRALHRGSVNATHTANCDAAKAVQRVRNKPCDSQLDRSSSKKEQSASYQNLMIDRRVCRGSNFAANLSGHQGDGESAAARAAEARRRALARQRAKNQQIKAAELRLGSPPPIAGRKHIPVQTELYLEEIFDHPPVNDICTQTDLFCERPISPFYVPMKLGEDVSTQIYPGDLFDFDMEVQPILEVLVGKTLEQALIEVMEEEELASLREQQRKFLEIRAVEIAEMQRLEERERRWAKEKERRLAQFAEGCQIERELEDRIAASVLMQGYIADLLPNVLEGLQSEGILMDNIKQDVDNSFMPWLMTEVANELGEMVSSRDILTDIVREVLGTRAQIYKDLNKTPVEVLSDADEEEGVVSATLVEDQAFKDHLKLKEEFHTATELL